MVDDPDAPGNQNDIGERSFWSPNTNPALPAPEDDVVAALPDPQQRDPGRRGLPPAFITRNGTRAYARHPTTVAIDLLTAHNGPLTQVELRNRTGFPATTLSLALSELEDDGTITKIKKGRTFVVYLSDDVPESEFGHTESIPRHP